MQTEEQGNPEKALQQLEKAIQSQPKNEEYLIELRHLGHRLGRQDIEIKALLRLHEMEALDLEGTFSLCVLLASTHRYRQALDHIEECLRVIPHRRVKSKKTMLKAFEHQRLYCEAMLHRDKRTAKPLPVIEEPALEKAHKKEEIPAKVVKKSPPLEIQVQMEVETLPLQRASIEERILDILDKKINMFEMVIGEIDMVLGRVTTSRRAGGLKL